MFLLLSLVSNKYFDIDSKEHASFISFINYIKFPFTSIEILNEIRIVDSRHIRASQPLFKKIRSRITAAYPRPDVSLMNGDKIKRPEKKRIRSTWNSQGTCKEP